MSFCGPLFQIDDAKYEALQPTQAMIGGKTLDGNMAISFGEDRLSGQGYIIARGKSAYAVECESFSLTGVPGNPDAVANTLRSMVNASDGMEIVGGKSTGALNGAAIYDESHNFTVWGALPQKDAAIWIEILADGMSMHADVSVSRAN